MGRKVAAVRTPWGTPQDHTELCRNMNAILASCGVTSATVRRRMTAHAIVASGWAQKVWCHNAWGVKTGKSWSGDYYLMTTQEDDGSGTLYTVPNDAWRAFAGWQAAVDDFRARISPTSSRYAKAHAALVSEQVSDEEYWKQLGLAGYYTDTTNMTPGKFGSLCDRVAKETADQVLEVPGSGPFRDELGDRCGPDCCAARARGARCPRPEAEVTP